MTFDRRKPGRWLDSATPLERMLWSQHNVASVAQAKRFLSLKAIRHQVDSGRWQRVRRGIIAAHNGPLSHDQQLWVAVLIGGPGAVLAGTTAAQQSGFRSPLARDNALIHIAKPSPARVGDVPHDVVVHRVTTLQPEDIHRYADPPRTKPTRSIVDGAAWAARNRDAYTLVVAAYQQRRVRPGEITTLLSRLPKARRRSVILRAAADAEMGVHSELEGLVVAGLRKAGLPLPTLQRKRRDGDGRIRYLDGYYEQWRLHIEIDGSGHLDQLSYWRDMKRQNALWVAGDRVLRFPAVAVRYHLADVIGQIRQALMAAGWRP